jgi:hypothetical protein
MKREHVFSVLVNKNISVEVSAAENLTPFEGVLVDDSHAKGRHTHTHTHTHTRAQTHTHTSARLK